ncbi:MAG: hypothetical protein MN733_39910, partial [Nitrososphaera sp.]|nr:hypothetical protein [Nitrososphaera sp.]
MLGINTDRLIAYEEGLLDEIDIIDLFQSLIDSGLIDHLQGHYGRTAARLIADGSCTPKGYVSVPEDDDVYAMHGIDDGPNPDDFHPSPESGVLEDNPETCDDWNRI